MRSKVMWREWIESERRGDKECERLQNGKLDGDVKVQDRVRGREIR